jgi:hypothetical protein
MNEVSRWQRVLGFSGGEEEKERKVRNDNEPIPFHG